MKKMLIGFVIDGKSGGVDKYILSTVDMLCEDYEIDVLSTCKTPELDNWLSERNARLVQVSSLKKPLAQYKEIDQLIKENKYDVAYLNTSTAMMFPMLLAAKKNDVQHRIVHSHASDVDSNNKIIYRIKRVIHSICKLLIEKSANMYWSVSPVSALWMYTRKVISKKNFKVIPNSIDFNMYTFNQKEREELRERYNIKDEIVVGHVSNFMPIKNTPFLVDILKDVTDRNVDARLLLVGEGPQKSLVMNKAKELGLIDKIIDVGFQSDVRPFYQMMDVFVLPSLKEGFPYVALETQVNGLLCLLSEGVTKSAILSDYCYLIKDIDDASMWSDKIVSCIPYDRVSNTVNKKANQYDVSFAKKTIISSFGG